jgi:hypothetical protein
MSCLARYLYSILALAAAIGLCAGCSTMLDSNAADLQATIGCTKNSGAYYLPKKLVKIEIRKGLKRGYDFKVYDDLASVPDRRQIYCLDYLSSPTSHDEIAIARSTDGLLSRIYTRADDKSKEILTTLVDAATLAASAQRARDLIADTNQNPVLASYEFDPFDPEQSVIVNAGLRRFGYCIFVEGYTFPRDVPPLSWCESPGRVAAYLPTVVADRLPPTDVSHGGVLYRPNMTHPLHVVHKLNPYGRDAWKLALTRQIEVPNGSPAFVVQAKRSLFVDRITDLEFIDGVLTNISIKKPSEMAVFVDVPLYLARAVVGIPTKALKIRINDETNRLRLIAAQNDLIVAQRLYNDELKNLAAQAGPAGGLPAGVADTPVTGDPRSVSPATAAAVQQRAIDNCLLTGETPENCRNAVR